MSFDLVVLDAEGPMTPADVRERFERMVERMDVVDLQGGRRVVEPSPRLRAFLKDLAPSGPIWIRSEVGWAMVGGPAASKCTGTWSS